MNQAAPADDTDFARHPTTLAWLALCPLLAASTSPAGALGLGVAACAVFGLGGLTVTTLGRWLPYEVRLAAIAALVSGLAIAATRCLMLWLPEIHDALGRTVPLIVAGSILVVGADTSSWTQPGPGPLARVVTAGVGGVSALVAIGAIRALAGHGTQLAQRPAGGFLLLGLLLAGAAALRRHAAAARARRAGSTR